MGPKHEPNGNPEMTFTRKSSSMKRLCWSSAMEPKNSTSKPSSANTVLVLEALPPRVLEWKILFLIFTGSALLENNKGHWPCGLCTLLSVNKLFWLFHFHRYLAPLDSKSQCTLPRSFVSRWFVPLSQAKQLKYLKYKAMQTFTSIDPESSCRCLRRGTCRPSWRRRRRRDRRTIFDAESF